MSGLRTELTLHKVNKRLIRRNVPLNERRRIRRDLRENLREASDAVGEKCAVQQLGDAETLAAALAFTIGARLWRIRSSRRRRAGRSDPR